MPDALTRGALETLADLRRRGLVSAECPNRYEDGCRCSAHPTGPFGQKPVLRVLTMENLPPLPVEPCDGGYTCMCSSCRAERAVLVRRASRRAA